jgi:hypothetical protein
VPLLRTAGVSYRGQEGHYRLGDDIGDSPGQVVTSAFGKLQPGVRQGASEPAGGIDWNQGVRRVGEQEHWRPDRPDGALQLAELAQQSALLGQECPPQRPGSAARLGPDLPVDVLVGAQRAAAPPAGMSEPGPRDPWRQPPRHQRAQRPGARCGQQPVPDVTHPGPTLPSRTTACTRCGARLAAGNATPPP